MPFDMNNGVTGGGVALSLVAYGFLSAYATGPTIITREAQKIGWHGQCMAHVEAKILERAPKPDIIPNLDCNALMGGLFGSQSHELCRLIDPFTNMADQINRRKERAAEFARQRLIEKAQQSGSACSCAVTSFTSQNRLNVGLYAGTARFVTPLAIQNLKGSLMTHLNSPICQKVMS